MGGLFIVTHFEDPGIDFPNSFQPNNGRFEVSQKEGSLETNEVECTVDPILINPCLLIGGRSKSDDSPLNQGTPPYE